MFVLWMFGREIEYQWGYNRFIKYYFLTGLGAGVLNVIVNPNGYIPSIGASGAISGLIGLMLVWGHQDGTGSGLQIRNGMARWVLYILIFGFFVGGIDNAGHIGGLIAGGLVALALPPNFGREDSAAWKTLGVLATLMVIAAVILIGYLGFMVIPPAPG